MEFITLGQLGGWLGLIAGIITSVGIIYKLVEKAAKKRINEEIEQITGPIITELSQIQTQNEELSKKQDEMKKELILMAKINQAMIEELKTLGHVNGETAQALKDFTDYIMTR